MTVLVPIANNPAHGKSTAISIGIVGGGQLARMLVLSGARLGLRFKIYDPSPDACAGMLAPLTCGAFADATALLAFARDLDVLTFDFENVPASTLAALTGDVKIAPNPAVLAMTQDRLSEKVAFGALGIPIAPFRAVSTPLQMLQAVQDLGVPGILKTRTLGYDGKGQTRVDSPSDAEAAFARLGLSPCVYEQIVPFSRELSMLAVRSERGEFCCYPLTENVHDAGILAASLAPARTTHELDVLAVSYARNVAKHFNYVGTFALEFFQVGEALVLNEMAPRVHNSGHWTIEGAECSQFENHLRAVAGLPLGSTYVRQPSLMLNWVGELPNAELQLAIANLAWHDYGKSARVGRKVGHSTLCGESFEALSVKLNALQLNSPTRTGSLAQGLLNRYLRP
jgi:5-(carboxyamino)imidazole ribonucleotide synthase